MSGVFLSYAREDLPFVRRVHDALSAAGRDPAWDQDHAVVPFSSPYESEIAAAIAGSEKFVFVISPDSLDSAPCTTEIAVAADSNKQIIPLLRRAARVNQHIPPAIAERNWIFFDDDARFEDSLRELLETLDTDLDWVKDHTRLLVRAKEWTDGSGDRSRLLRGKDLRTAEAWLAQGDAHAQAPPTSSQRAFIAASRRAAERVAWLVRTTLAAGLVIALALASFAFYQRAQAIDQRNTADYNETVAEGLEYSSTDTPLAAQLDLAAYHMRSGSDLASRLLSTENTPLSSPVRAGTQSAYAMAYSPDGRLLASGDGDGTVRLWDVTDPAHPAELGRPLTDTWSVFAVAFSPDGHALATADANGEIRLWDVADPAHPELLGAPVAGDVGTAVISIAFSRDGGMLAASDDDGAVWLWDVTDLAHPRLFGRPLTSGAAVATTVALSPVGSTLAVGLSSNEIQLWDVADPAHPRSLGSPFTNAAEQPVRVVFSPSGSVLAAGTNDGTALWDVADLARPRLLGEPLPSGTGATDAVQFSPDGNTLATGNTDGSIRLWDVAQPAQPELLGQPLTGLTRAVLTLAFSPDGHALASGNDDGTIRLWNLPETTLVGGTGSVLAIAFSPDGRTLASAGLDGAVWLWDVADLAHTYPAGPPLTGGTGAADSVAFSPDGRVLAVGSEDGTIRLWDVTDPAHPSLLGPPLTAGSGAVDSVAFSRDGMLASGDHDGTLRTWYVADPARPRPLARFGVGVPIESVAFSPDSRTLVSASNAFIDMWNVAKDPFVPPPLFIKPLVVTNGEVISVAFSPDGRVLATGANDSTVRLWNVVDPARPQPIGSPLSGGTGSVYSVAFSPNGDLLASGDDDATIRLWNVANPAQPQPLDQPLTGGTQAVYSVAFSPGGQMLAGGSIDGATRLWNPTVNYATNWICSTAGNLTSQQWPMYIQMPYQPLCPH